MIFANGNLMMFSDWSLHIEILICLHIEIFWYFHIEFRATFVLWNDRKFCPEMKERKNIKTKTNSTKFASLVGSFGRWARSERLPNAQCTHSQHGGNMTASSSLYLLVYFLHISCSFCHYIFMAETRQPLHNFIHCLTNLDFSCAIVVIFPWAATWLEHDSLYIILFVAIFVAYLIFIFFFLFGRDWNMAVDFVIFLSSSPFHSIT